MPKMREPVVLSSAKPVHQYWVGELYNFKVGVQGAIWRCQGKCMRVMGCPAAAPPAEGRINLLCRARLSAKG